MKHLHWHPGSTIAAAALAFGIAACGSNTVATPAPTATPAAAEAVAPQAAFQQLKGVDTRVDIDAGTLGVLTSNKVTVAPVAPATATPQANSVQVAFPITSGYVAVYPTDQLPFVRGSFSHSGGLTFSAGAKQLVVSDFMVNPGSSSLTATVNANGKAGGPAVKLFDLDGSKVQITKDSQGMTHLDGTVAMLSADAATAMNETFGVSLFKQGIVIGVVHITATGAADPGGAPTQQIEQLSGRTTSVDLDAGTSAVLSQNHVTVGVVAPATISGGTVSFPITEGYAAVYPGDQLPFIRGTIAHSGGLTFSAGGKTLTVTDFVINPGSSTLSATVSTTGAAGGSVISLLDLDGSKVQVSKGADGTVHLDGTVAEVSTDAAAAMNSYFGVSLFKQGIVIGVAHIVAAG